MTGPLSGIRILDLTSVVAGPFATQMLGDMGADVIKIEAPEGDAPRHTGPARSPDMAALFMGLNRSKRSLVLDLKQPAAAEALWRLIAGADVFVHSMRPQKIEKLGFGHQAVCARNPRIVYAALHGYRDGGPYSGQPAYDDVIQGQSGIAALMAKVAGEPRYAPMIIADKTCALAIVGAVSAALFARERSGRGQFVEIPMFEQMVSFVLGEHLFGHNFVPPVGELGYTRVLASWRRPYRTKDGYLCMMAYTQAHWRKFWTMVGKTEVHSDPRFDSIASRAATSSRFTSWPGPASPARPRMNGWRCCASLKFPRHAWRASTRSWPILSLRRRASSNAPAIRPKARSSIRICRCALAIPRYLPSACNRGSASIASKSYARPAWTRVK